jgi:hypothetical protein
MKKKSIVSYNEQKENGLIKLIGTRSFSICDEDFMAGEYKHPSHPYMIRLIDCEFDSMVDVCSGFGKHETRAMAEAMLKLLNGEKA